MSGCTPHRLAEAHPGRVYLPVIGLSDRALRCVLRRRLRFQVRSIGRRGDLRVDDARIHGIRPSRGGGKPLGPIPCPAIRLNAPLPFQTSAPNKLRYCALPPQGWCDRCLLLGHYGRQFRRVCGHLQSKLFGARATCCRRIRWQLVLLSCQLPCFICSPTALWPAWAPTSPTGFECAHRLPMASLRRIKMGLCISCDYGQVHPDLLFAVSHRSVTCCCRTLPFSPAILRLLSTLEPPGGDSRKRYSKLA